MYTCTYIYTHTHRYFCEVIQGNALGKNETLEMSITKFNKLQSGHIMDGAVLNWMPFNYVYANKNDMIYFFFF